MRTLNATEFKAKCLAILEEVAASGEPVTILKRGRPIAQLVPAFPLDAATPQASLAGSITIVGDVVAPVLSPDDWEAEAAGEAASR